MLQPVERLAVAKADGFAPGIGRGHDQHRRQGRTLGQQVKKYGVQGRVGQHNAHLARIGRDLWRQPPGAVCRCPAILGHVARAENNGFFRALQQGLVLWRESTQGAGRGKVAHHEGQRLVGAGFALPQLSQALGIARIAGQLKAPQTLECQNFPFAQGVHGFFERRVHVFGCGDCRSLAGRCCIHKPQARAAHRTGHGLGVKTSVCGIGVFCGALRAERKAAHGSNCAVVGN